MQNLESIPVDPASSLPKQRRRGTQMLVLLGVAVLGLEVAVLVRVDGLRDDLRSLERQAAVESDEILRLESRLRTAEEALTDINELVRPIVVPDVVGLRLSEAKELLGRSGLRSSVVDGDSTDPDSQVTAQEPGASVPVPRDAAIGLRTTN
ncbi:MAG: PASTA domain-containing protein [Acidimicrobiia bacterium]